MSDELRVRLRGLASFPAELPAFDPSTAPADPEALFLDWLQDAVAHGVLAAHAPVLSTIDEGGPSARVLMLRDIDAVGWLIGTPADSRPGRALSGTGVAALTFFWPERGRQVRVEGTAVQGSLEESAADARAREAATGHAGPESWSLWRVIPTRIEFWQASHDRHHLRLSFDRAGEGWEARRIDA